MFYSYNYFRQWNNNQEIKNHKEFYKKFSNSREFGGSFTHMDHLRKTRFSNTIGHMYNVVLRKQPDTILDIGCGDGVNLPLANIFPNIEYHGIDYAEKTVEVARKNYPNIHFKIGDAFDLPYENKTFDMAILSSVLILYKSEEDRIKLLKEAHRVLKEDGILVIVVWNDTFFIRNAMRISRMIGKRKGDNLPQDFMGCHFKKRDVDSMIAPAGWKIAERIMTSQLFGVLECAQYLNRKKYHRDFGNEHIKIRSLNQNIKRDLQFEAGGGSGNIQLLWLLYKFHPNGFAWNNMYILEKK